jgi:alpha-L-fucosidase
MPGEDVQTFEQDLPGQNTTGFNEKVIGTLPLETSLTMNGSWGFNITDMRFKSARDLIGYVVRAAGQGGNLLLNVGPRPDGTIQPEAVDRLRQLGEFMAAHGGALYGTRAGPVPPRAWGATTQRGDSVFVHVLDWPDATLALPPFARAVGSATVFPTGARIAFAQNDRGVTIELPASAAIDRIVVLRLGRARP